MLHILSKSWSTLKYKYTCALARTEESKSVGDDSEIDSLTSRKEESQQAGASRDKKTKIK